MKHNFFRRDLNLASRWWHRLVKVLFTLLTALMAWVACALFYELEESRATEHRITKSLRAYFDETKQGLKVHSEDRYEDLGLQPVIKGLPPGAKLEPITKPLPAPHERFKDGFLDLGGEYLVAESFVNDKSLSGDLGCLQADGKVDWLYTVSFKERVDCRIGKSKAVCFVPDEVCKGDASAIVRYERIVKYSVRNYLNIIGGSGLTMAVWFGICFLIYYKGVVYIVFGAAGSS